MGPSHSWPFDGLQEELEKVQNRAARFVTRNYVFETGSTTGILGQLKWESLKKRRNDSRLILLFTIFALSAGFLLTKINIGKTGNQNPPSGGFVVTCFSNIDFLKLGTSE